MAGSRKHPTSNAEVARALAPEDKPCRKNHSLSQSRIDMAKKILGAQTETEALEGALDMLIYGEALARGTEAMKGEEYMDVLGLADEVPGTGEKR